MPCDAGQRFSGYPAYFTYDDCNQAGPYNFGLADIQSQDFQFNNRVSVRRPPGVVDPVQHLLAKSEPMWNLQTHDLLTALTHIDLYNGLCIDESNFWLQQRAQCEGAFATGSNHIKYTVWKGFVIVDSISADINDEDGAVANFRLYPLHVPQPAAGPMKPLVETTTGDDLTGAPNPNYVSSYWLSSVFFGSSEVKGIQSVQVQPQITVQGSPSSPHTFNQLMSITVRETVFRIRALKINDYDSYNHVPGDISSEVALYLQKADPTNSTADGRVAPTAANHIKISASTGIIDFQTRSYSGTDDAVIEYIIRLEGVPAIALTSALPNNSVYTA